MASSFFRFLGQKLLYVRCFFCCLDFVSHQLELNTFVSVNNVTLNFMVKHTINGKKSDADNSYRISVKVYYKPAIKLTADKNSISVRWNTEGLWVPDRALIVLREGQKDELCAMLTQDLGIPEERQEVEICD